MRRAWGVLLPAALLAAGLLLHTPAAWSCSCVRTTVARQLEQAELVFVGTTTIARADRATFAVEEIFKGRLPRSVEIATAASEATCGVSFVAGGRYTVFATASADRVTTNLCSGTTDAPDVVGRARAAGEKAGTTAAVQPPAPAASDGGSKRAGALAAAGLLLAFAGGALGMRWLRAR